MTFKEFIVSTGLRYETHVPIALNPDMGSDPKWKADHWLLTIESVDSLREQGRGMFTCYFSQGMAAREKAMSVSTYGHRPIGPPGSSDYVRKGTIAWQEIFDRTPPPVPSLESVIECLASDARSIVNSMSFEEWADEFGMDVDSRKAEKTYRVCQEQAARLRSFLGPSAFSQLLECEET